MVTKTEGLDNSTEEAGLNERVVMLPCPWCGCAEVEANVSEICCPIQYSATAACVDCGAEEPCGSGVYDSKEDAEKEAFKMWNDRTT